MAIVSVKKPKSSVPQQKFIKARKEMSDALIERDGEIDMVLMALIAKEHPFLVGVPGTGKTLLLESVFEWTNGTTKKFHCLFTKFTTPEEVFGPISVKGLKEDQYRRITTGMLPEAHVAFVDEIWKGSSAISNTLLKAMNERTFVNGDGVAKKIPLMMLMAASNECPDENNGGKELNAMFDRFLFRKKVSPIRSKGGRDRLLWGGDHKPKFTDHITSEEVHQAHEEASALTFTDDAKEAFLLILKDLAKEGIVPGDRRQYKSVGACKAHAFLMGKDEVEAEDLAVLTHTLWDDPKEQPEKCYRVVLKNATPLALVINDLLMTIEDVVAKNTPTEAVPKLQSIKKELMKQKDSEHKKKAVEYVSASIKECYDQVVGGGS